MKHASKAVAAYVHAAPPLAHEGCTCHENPPDTTYYTSAKDGERYVALTGPFETHLEALEAVPGARTKAYEYDTRACWYAYGTFAAKPGAEIKVVFGA